MSNENARSIGSSISRLAFTVIGSAFGGLGGVAISLGGNFMLGAADARRVKRQIEQNRRQRELTITLPATDGLWVIELPFEVPSSDPGPAARMQWLREFFADRSGGPWSRMFLDERDGFPIVPGSGARLLAAAPALSEPRTEYAEVWTARCSGHCMAPWLDGGVEVVIDPATAPKVGGLVAAYLAHDDADPLGKWLLAPVPPRAEWDRHPDAVAVLGSADVPHAMIAVPLLALDLLVEVKRTGAPQAVEA